MHENLPLISVIVPNYNHKKYLKERLDSVFNQTYQNFEVILLDDCSTDGSINVLLEYAQRDNVSHCIFNEKNSENTFKQWQKGIELSKGDFVWIAESDDYCTPDFLKKVVAPLIEDDQIVLSYCQSNKVDSEGERIGNWIDHTNSINANSFKNDFQEDGNSFITKYLIFINVIPNASGVLLRRKNLFLPESLLKNNDLRTCGDWIIYLQQIINFKVAFISESLNNFRYHSNSVIAKVVKEEGKKNVIDINLKMRQVFHSILKMQKPVNYSRINSQNKAIIKSLKYDKSILLIRNNQKWKGYLILISVLDEFFKRYKFRKNLKVKLKRFIS